MSFRSRTPGVRYCRHSSLATNLTLLSLSESSPSWPVCQMHSRPARQLIAPLNQEHAIVRCFLSLVESSSILPRFGCCDDQAESVTAQNTASLPQTTARDSGQCPQDSEMQLGGVLILPCGTNELTRDHHLWCITDDSPRDVECVSFGPG